MATHGLHITAPCSSTVLSSLMHIDTHLNSYTWKDQDGFPLACYNIIYYNWIATSNCRWGCFASGTIKILRKSLKSYLGFSYPGKGILLLFSNVRSSHDLNAQQIVWCHPKEWKASAPENQPLITWTDKTKRRQSWNQRMPDEKTVFCPLINRTTNLNFKTKSPRQPKEGLI